MEPETSSMESKKPRKRMKGIYSKLCEQIEFYFSDSNFHKDQFLKRQVDKSPDGYIEIAMFLSFNRVKNITDDASVIARSLAWSSVLQMSEDKKFVRRLVPYTKPKNVDERTVYVEFLPPNVDHDWVKKVFSCCGNVTYVSLPRYKTTRDMKGFAFVEYETEEAAEKACQVLNNPPPEAGHVKPGKFPKTNKNLMMLKRKAQIPAEMLNAGDEKCEPLVGGEDGAENKCTRNKRKRQASGNSTDGKEEMEPSKRRKMESTEEGDCKHTAKLPGEPISEGLKLDEEGKCCSKKRKHRQQRLETSRSQDEESEVSLAKESEKGEKVRSKRKRKLESRSSAGSEAEIKCGRVDTGESGSETAQATADDSVDKENGKRKKKWRKKKSREKDYPQLRVISKKQWCELKNEYLSLQKANMSLLKKSLAKIKTAEADLLKKKLKASYEFTPGVIVKVLSDGPMSRKQLSDALAHLGDIAYIDVKEADTQAFVRCRNRESATKIAESSLEAYSLSLLSGEADRAYWEKLSADREMKLASKRQKKRGSQKLIDRAQKINDLKIERKHIIFTDD